MDPEKCKSKFCGWISCFLLLLVLACCIWVFAGTWSGSSTLVAKSLNLTASSTATPLVLVVASDGSGNFTTIGAAIQWVPLHNDRRILVQIKAGVYREKIAIPKFKSYITLQGEGSSSTIVTFNATASDLVQVANNGSDQVRLRTFNSATVAVDSKNFIARDISFRNTAPVPRPEEMGKQAVALRISGDMAAFYNCSFYGSQDTLYDHKGRHYFESCYIQGTVDFVFGYGRSLYKDCHLKSISNLTGSVTAQKRNHDMLNSGFSFVDCRITGSGSVYLGRAWGDRSRVVFANTYMEKLIVPEGWQDWNDPSRNRNVFYGEYNCSGPGANLQGRVPWVKVMTLKEAEPFMTTKFVHGESWLAF